MQISFFNVFKEVGFETFISGSNYFLYAQLKQAETFF